MGFQGNFLKSVKFPSKDVFAGKKKWLAHPNVQIYLMEILNIDFQKFYAILC